MLFRSLDHALAAYQGGLSFAGDVAGLAVDSANQSADRVDRFASDALDVNSNLARTTIGAVQDSGYNALNAVTGANANALSAVTGANANVLDFASSLFDNALNAQHALTDQNLGAVSGLASQVSQSATQSTNDAVTKLATIVAIAVAAVFIFKGAH